VLNLYYFIVMIVGFL